MGHSSPIPPSTPEQSRRKQNLGRVPMHNVEKHKPVARRGRRAKGLFQEMAEVTERKDIRISSHIKLLNLVILLGVVLAAVLVAASAEGQTASTTVSLPANADTYLSQNSPSSHYGTNTTLMVDGDDPKGTDKDKRILIKFDLSQIPSGATILSANLIFRVVDASPNTYKTQQLKRNWTETGASWNTYDGTNVWGSAGASSSTSDRGGMDLAPFKVSGTGTASVPLNDSGISTVQGWVNGTTPNYGFIIWNSRNTNGVDLSSRESSIKPTLKVTHATTNTGPSAPPTTTGWTALEKYNYYERVGKMEDWLAGDRPYIGEINSPNHLSGPHCCDVPQWNALLEKMLVRLDGNYASISFWSVDERQKYGGYSLNTYTSGSDGRTTRAIDTPVAGGQYTYFERHLADHDYKRGFNEAAGTQLESGQYAGSPGTYGESGDYHYAGKHVSAETGQDTFQFMTSRGYDHVRLGFRMERLQPKLGGELDATELDRLKSTIADANAAGLGVVLDAHNYGYWKYADGAYYQLGDGNFTKEHFYDFWRRMSIEFKQNSGVIAYDLMNEPGVQGTIPGGASAWQTYSQGALDIIRANGDNKLIYVPTWRNSMNAPFHHPSGKWIKDPADNFQYAFHIYFWIDGWKDGGNYSRDYSTENELAKGKGYTDD